MLCLLLCFAGRDRDLVKQMGLVYQGTCGGVDAIGAWSIFPLGRGIPPDKIFVVPASNTEVNCVVASPSIIHI